MAIISITSTSVAVNPLKQSQPVGATLAFLGLQGMMPMLHGSPGCSAFTKVVLTKHLGKVFPLSSTAMTEVSTILGGEENIEKAIAKLVQISQPKMIGICTTGLTETRGDDMGRLLKDMRQRYSELSQVPIYLVSTPDFKGTLQDGFAAAVESIVKEIPQTTDRQNCCPKQITILASSAFTPGDLQEIKEIVSAFGLQPIIVPDISGLLNIHALDDRHSLVTSGGTSLPQLRAIPHSVFTIALGESMRGAARILSQKFCTPYEVFDTVSGLEAADKFLQALADISSIPVPAKYRYQRLQLQDAMLDAHFYFGGKRVSLALEPDLLWSTVSFLQSMGAQIHAAVTTARSPLLEKLPITSVTIGDLEDFEQLAVGSDLLISNSHAVTISQRLTIPIYRQGIPIYDRLGHNQSTKVGYRGTMQYLFDIGNLLYEQNKAKV
ncbi:MULTISPECIES: nitrogenase iron-molybdenum cofactor biosynthesis protein NifN [unclassified Tolypothrix]|uniref:nitrogenase iron-molybdenum cofactor biosynthesis protein NifN n=1 Tax=unclassified Tolypothrix TaxID=2649714 RepID=UPI0005EAB5CC|nr:MULTISPECIES: nitrogenase iron-molybdenum cofactor biosynthesis protein NifN [unclassified Tolypothrix]BAY91249.1 nitrogenase molybdenum-iron cofactor biosynthesis protein NifN [Microchaete diplosiphon NIES-3275]EKF04234.1 nitrogenase molybdenum-iron cofactor biosynthesis protein NifN [Tolypothrix sp. PCC 7601]MBE9080889.1 nitrogenase iron-molybdenum cofactor biosynthesis protein NifN [Tolypothrix sp. LEGE 11397]UYD25325.1 nitrogenase iron-molybdenum cofactor biosynthesis protein NifN [Tolyp